MPDFLELDLNQVWEEERALVLAAAAVVMLLNVRIGWYVLWPLRLFSTWVHEMCHGIAAMLVGGSIDKLQVFADGGGLAFTRYKNTRLRSAWVASAGYLGTAVVGATMLALRHHPASGTVGLQILSGALFLSVALFVRNVVGIVALFGMAVALVAAGRVLEDEPNAWIYTFVATTCCLNAVTSIRDLFGRRTASVGGRSTATDAEAVAHALLLPHWFWATLWLATSLVLVAWALGARFEF